MYIDINHCYRMYNIFRTKRIWYKTRDSQFTSWHNGEVGFPEVGL